MEKMKIHNWLNPIDVYNYIESTMLNASCQAGITLHSQQAIVLIPMGHLRAAAIHIIVRESISTPDCITELI